MSLVSLERLVSLVRLERLERLVSTSPRNPIIMEKRKNIILRKESQRQWLIVLCIVLLGGVVLYAASDALQGVLGEASNGGKSVRAEIRQKKVRYRFRRIYNGGDVMTAPHVGQLTSVPTYSGSPSSFGGSQSGVSLLPSAVRVSRSGVSGRSSGLRYQAVAPVSYLESEQSLKSYVSGGGSVGGGATGGGSVSGAVGGIAMGGGYSVGYGLSIPSVGALRPSSSSSTVDPLERSAAAPVVVDNAAAAAAMMSAVGTLNETSTGTPAKRRINFYDEEAEETVSFDESGTEENGTTHTVNGITYIKSETGVWYYEDALGQKYTWNGVSFELNKNIPEGFFPIGDVPYLALLLAAALFAFLRRRKREEA